MSVPDARELDIMTFASRGQYIPLNNDHIKDIDLFNTDYLFDMKWYHINRNSAKLEKILTLLIRDFAHLSKLTNVMFIISDYCCLPPSKSSNAHFDKSSKCNSRNGLWCNVFHCEPCRKLSLKTPLNTPFLRNDTSFDSMCRTCSKKASVCMLYTGKQFSWKVSFCQICFENHGYTTHDSDECDNPFDFHPIIISESSQEACGLPWMTGIEASVVAWSRGLPRPVSACNLCFNNFFLGLIHPTKHLNVKIFRLTDPIRNTLVCDKNKPPKSILKYDPPIEKNNVIFRPKQRAFASAHFSNEKRKCNICKGWKEPICDVCNCIDVESPYWYIDALANIFLCCDSKDPYEISDCAKKFGYIKVAPILMSEPLNHTGMCAC
ncbi:MAG: hypothetical protein Hyperionvirus4_150 [Hyperionvirus sp.]|uniref:Uncharacterized protein n=1 Tax=Hyperionvirus sp. TaxID=2487770 RepID=A0A3G5A7H9_9VIRU|nr:MAG: hypothetical protein Hyperionvirus4_150 [Hyperionvirus sp.]